MAISSPNSASNAYTDLSALNDISIKGREDTAAGLKQVAAQFEAMFLNIMLKSMRDSNKALSEGSYLNSNEMEFYQQNFDDQMSVHLSEGKGMGLADSLYRQLLNQFDVTEQGADKDAVSGEEVDEEFGEVNQTGAVSSLPEANSFHPRFANSNTASSNRSVDTGNAAPSASPKDSGPAAPNLLVTETIRKVEDFITGIAEQFASPAEFIDQLYPAAKKAAARIGVDPEVLLAQSALETGWGKKIVHDRSGNSSHNLFGIKADSSWQGDNAVTDTVEYQNGVAQREQASFRRYQSYQESFDDYVKFLQSNPRYGAALENVKSAQDFAEKLAEAGYATDPVYAEKINRVLNSPVMQDALTLRAGS